MGIISVLTTTVLGAAPQLTVPRTDTAPTIDGAIDAREWGDAAAVSGMLSQLDSVADPRPATFWIKIDDENVYIAQRSTVRPREWSPKTPSIWLGNDSSFVIGLAPGRVNRGDTPSHYLMRVNLDGKQRGYEIAWKIAGVNLRFPHPSWVVNPVIKHSFNADKTVWESELAIPLASMNVKDLQDIESWGVFFARDYEQGDQTAIVASSDWRFGNGNRHYGRAFFNNYRMEKEYATATIQSGAAAVQLLGIGDLIAGTLAPHLALRNNSDAPQTIGLRLEVRSNTDADKTGRLFEQTFDLAPGEQLEHRFASVQLTANQHSLVTITAADAKGQVLFRRELPVRPGHGTDLVQATPDFYLSGGHFGGKNSDNVLLPSGYDPILNRFYGRLRIGSLPEAHLAKTVSVTIRRGGDPEPVATLTPLSVSTPSVQLKIGDNSFHYQPATVLEWVCPETGTVDIDMEGAHVYNPTPHTDGEAMRVLHVSDGKTEVLIPRQVFINSKEWKPIAKKDINVRAGDKIQFYYDKNGHEGCDDFRLRGTLTHTGVATRIFNPAGELSSQQGGQSGVWFYRYDTDNQPNADGQYPELKWDTKKHWFKSWDKDPKRNQAIIRRIVASGNEMIVDDALPELQPGVYQATASVYAEDGRLLGQARQTFIRYDHEKDMPWIGNQLGVSNQVLPPWTPISHRPTSPTFSVWGRDYRVDGSGLFTGIDTATQSGLDQAPQDILAGPVSIELVRDGKPVALVPDAAPGDVQVADHLASWQGTLTGDGWRIETDVDMEYDGYALHRVRIIPPAMPSDKSDRSDHLKPSLDRLRLIIPLKPEYATHLHAAAGQWFRSSVSSIKLGNEDGRLWHSGQNHGGGTAPNGTFGGLMTVGDFKPYVWIGGANRGLAFMADNDQGWVPDDSKTVHAIEVVRVGSDQSENGANPTDYRSLITDHSANGSAVCLILNLVARPFAFDKPREIVFSLQATPIKPMRDDFRFRRRQYTMGSAFTGSHPNKSGWSWDGGMFWIDDGKGGRQMLFGHPASPPYRVNWNIAEWYQKQADKGGFHGKDWVNTPYQSLQNVHNFPEADDPRMPPGKQCGDVYGYIFPHMSHRHLEHGNPVVAQPDMEYRLWCYDTWIGNVGLKGMYFDQTEPVLTAHPEAGFGYRLDLHDRPSLTGRIQPGYGLRRMREFYKRLRTLFVQHKVDYPYIWIHSTDANMVSAFAFTDTFLEGENMPRLSEKHPWISDKIPPPRMQAIHNSAGKWGINMTQLPMIDGAVYRHTHPMHNAIYRCWQGWYMLHDVEPHEPNLPWRGGIDLKRPAVFLPYWDATVAANLATNDSQVFASAYRQDDKLLIVVFNRNGHDIDNVELDINPAELDFPLDIGKPFTVVDLESKQELTTARKADDRFTAGPVTIKARDYRMLQVRQTAAADQ